MSHCLPKSVAVLDPFEYLDPRVMEICANFDPLFIYKKKISTHHHFKTKPVDWHIYKVRLWIWDQAWLHALIECVTPRYIREFEQIHFLCTMLWMVSYFAKWRKIVNKAITIYP